LLCLQYTSIMLKYAVLNMLADLISLREVRTECSYGGRGPMTINQPLVFGGGAEFEVTPLPPDEDHDFIYVLP